MKGVFKIYILLICLLVLPSSLLAQAGGNTRIMIRGVVTSATDNESLPGANVVLMNKDERIITHAITDLDGNYSLLADVKPGDKLVVSYTGFIKQEISLGTRTTINVKMQEDAIMLEGAVIVAQRRVNNGMLSVNERDLTTAATRISMADIADNMAGASIDDALQGRIAGMDMTAGSGAPGTGMSIRIRGTTSINGSSQPLIVVDGFPYETEVSSDFDFSNADEEQYSQMLNIAPDDIQEIVVLKDAAATAIYGSRAANGVLQITTKRGVKGKPRVSYTFKGTVSQKPSTIPTLTGDQYTTMIQEAMLNSGSLYNPISNPEFAYDVNQPYYFYNYGQNTNWFNEVTQRGFAQDHNLSVTGGGEKAQYRLSLGYYDNEGTIIGTGLQRINTRLNVDYDVSEQIKFQASMTYTHSENDQNYITYLNKNYDVSNGAFTRMPNMSIYEYNEVGALTGNYFSPLSSPQGYWNGAVSNPYNPVAMANEAYHKFTSDRIISNLSLIYRPADWFRYQFDVSLDVLNEKKSAFLPQTATGRPWSELQVNRADDYDGEAFILTTYNKAIFTPRLGDKHDLMGLLGLNTSDKTAAGYSATTANSASPYLQDPSNPSRVNGSSIVGVGSSKSSNRTVSFFGTVQYGFLDRYLLNASIRGDGDSRFGSDYRWGAFPSVSARWRVSSEPFMKWSEKWLDELSVRGSYGVNGSRPKYDFAHIGIYNIYDYSYLGEAGTYLSNMEQINLRWERTTQQNIGLNFAALNNRVNIDLEFYKKRTNDLFFYNLNVPSSTGFTRVDMNVGTMDNQGWELSVNTTPVRMRDLTVRFDFNISQNKNYIREISDLYPMEKGNSLTNGDYVRRFEVDQPMGSFYGYMYDGVYLNQDQTIARDKNGNKIYTYDEKGQRIPVQMRFGYPSIGYEFQPGDARYVDVNNDGNIDYQDIVYLGNSTPKFTGGFGPTIRYKDFTVNAYFNFRYGNKVVNRAKMNLEKMYNFDNQSTAVLRRWRHAYENEADAPSDLLPRALYNTGYNYLGSDRFIEDGSFLRFKSLSLKYQVNRKLLSKTPLQEAYVNLLVNNLYVWTKYTGQDPEISMSNSDPFAIGYDDARVPRSREFTVTFNVTF